MTDDHPTDPSGLGPPSDPEDRLSFSELSAERHARLVADTVQLRLQPLYTKVDKAAHAVRTLADAFSEHTADEQKRHAAMLKVFAVKSALTPITLAIAIAALTLAIVGGPAQADAPVCQPRPADAGGP